MDMAMVCRTHLNSSWHNVELWKTIHPPPTRTAIPTRQIQAPHPPRPTEVVAVGGTVVEVEAALAAEAATEAVVDRKE